MIKGDIMNVLTTNEREGLEDVFLSIHTDNNKYNKIKNISSILLNKKLSFSTTSLFKRANFGLNRLKLSNLLNKISKKKKYLSK